MSEEVKSVEELQAISQCTFFFERMFGDAIGEIGTLSIFTLPNRRTAFFDDAGDAARHSVSESDRGQNVYFGCGLRDPEKFPAGVDSKGERGGYGDIVAVPGLWADLDAKDGAFKNKEAITGFLDSLPLEPSIVVDSGSGMHAHWLFREVDVLESDADRDAAQHRADQWKAVINAAAQKDSKHTPDAVADLPRILRVPMTLNQKDGREPAPVRLVPGRSDGGQRNPSDFERFFSSDLLVHPGTVSGLPAIDEVSVSLEAAPDRNALLLVGEVIDTFDATLAGNRPDLSDQSQSTYDMALANALVLVNWKDQAIVDLLVWNRRRKGLDTKQDNQQYYERTVAKARAASNDSVNSRRLEQGDEISRADTFDMIYKATGANVTRIMRTGKSATEAMYRVEFDGGRSEMVMDVKSFRQISIWEDVVFGMESMPPPSVRPKPAVWRQIIGQALRHVEDVADETETQKEFLRQKVISYGGGAMCIDDIKEQTLIRLIDSSGPFVDDGVLHINLAALYSSLKDDSSYASSRRRLQEELRSIGLRPRRYQHAISKAESNRQQHSGGASRSSVKKSYWIIQMKDLFVDA